MLTQLTKYLIQYRKVCIPQIGTFEIIQQSPQLRVADQMMTAPFYLTNFSRHDSLPDHQVNFFGGKNIQQRQKLQNELVTFGEQLKEKMQHGPFQWNGFGTLSLSSNEIVFEPSTMVLDALQKVPAEKVIRQNVAHAIVVGDQETTTHRMSEVLQQSIYEKPALIGGWIIVILAMIALIIILYLGKFQITAAGMKTKVAAITLLVKRPA
ncbi:MAG: hypothetical protein ACJ75F_02785 [Flavisolibacter sp.]